MAIRSLKQKLIVRNTLTLSSVFVIVMVIVFSLSYINYGGQLKERQQLLEENLLEKGRLLVIDKTSSFKVLVLDTSIKTVQEIVANNANEDSDLVYGGYIVAEDFQPWVWVDPDNPTGEYSKKAQLKTPSTEWALSLDDVSHREVQSGDETFLEVAAPVYIENVDENDMTQGLTKAGVVLYGFSKKSIAEEFAREEMIYKRNLLVNLLILGGLALATLSFGFVATRSQAATIAQPLADLASAADAIAAGKYNIKVDVRTGDEIEALATSFNAMTKDLEASYADLQRKNLQLEQARKELEDLNRHLEEKVEERTKQLAESESKFRTLFEESADAILLADEHHLLDCNPAMLTMMGYATKRDFLELEPIDIFPTHQPDGVPSLERLQTIFRLARGEGSRMFEWTNRRKDGSEFPTEIVITSFPLHGKRLLHMVFRDITERKKTEEALFLAQQKLVESAHSAGMNEIATGVLHNIGNILNSVNISTEEIDLTIKNSKIKGFLKANKIVRENLDHVGHFFTEHPKGKLIPQYYLSLGETMAEEYQIIAHEVESLITKVTMMRDVISTQQNYAKSSLYTENVAIADMVDDAIKLQAAALKKQGVRIQKSYKDRPTGNVPKVKLIHVLTNLIKNGQEAMAKNEKYNKAQDMVIEITREADDSAQIRVVDNGCGIKAENLDKIFSHGFTTKANGHGFGLHTCANFMTEMGGVLTVESEGDGHGAAFTLRFPLTYKEPNPV